MNGVRNSIRGALRTTIETLPLPWDATDEQAWEDWQSAVAPIPHSEWSEVCNCHCHRPQDRLAA